MLIDTEKTVITDDIKNFIWHLFDDVLVVGERNDYFRVIWSRPPISGLDFECLVTVDDQEAQFVHCRTNLATEELAFTEMILIDRRDPEFYEKFHAELVRELEPEDFWPA